MNKQSDQTKSQDQRLFRDMTYQACRRRYQEDRNRTIKSGASASMSGIEYYPKDWDAFEPHEFHLLQHAMSWNGLFQQKCNWLDVLNANHPKAKGK